MDNVKPVFDWPTATFTKKKSQTKTVNKCSAGHVYVVRSS